MGWRPSRDEVWHVPKRGLLRGRWRGWLLLLLLLLLLAWVLGCSFVQPRPVLPVAARSPREGLWRRAEGKGPRGSMIFLAVKDAIYTTLFGAPVEVPDVPSAFGNLTSEAATTAAKGVRAVEGAASSVYGWGLSKLQAGLQGMHAWSARSLVLFSISRATPLRRP